MKILIVTLNLGETYKESQKQASPIELLRPKTKIVFTTMKDK